MNIKPFKLGIVVLLTGCVIMPLAASELQPIALTMVESRGTGYFEPADHHIVIRSQPIRLFIRIRNTSQAEIFIRSRPDKAYAIELTDSAGKIVLVERKKSTGGDVDDNTQVTLSPGADRIIPIDIRRDDWEGVPEIVAGKASQYTVRIVYQTTDGKHLYSEPYTLIFNLIQ